MSKIVVPYSVTSRGDQGHEFDLQDLGENHTRFIMSINGNRITSTAKTTSEDYDKQFDDKLRKVEPPQRTHAFLDHHFEHYKQLYGDPTPFLDHLKYVVLHPLEQIRSKSPQVAAAFDWFNKIMDSMYKQHQVDKAKFLSRAFELALEKDPARPTKVQIQLDAMVALMDIDMATARGISDELTQDGLVKRFGSYPMFLIEPEGRRAVERMYTEHPATLPSIAISTGDGSPVVLQAYSPSATQTVNIGDEIQEARAFADQLSAALLEIQKVAPPDQFTEITDELEFLKKKLDSTTPPKTVIKTIKDELIKRVIGLPFDAAKWFGADILQRGS